MPAPAKPLHIALVPLDERPVNVELPTAIAAIAGARLLLPPAQAMPDLRQPGDVEAIGNWLSRIAGEVDAAVISIDTLVFGGLIAARTTADGTAVALTRLDRLRQLRQDHPGLPVSAVSLVMRASNSYNAQEEPLYWSEYGKEIHRLGGLHHRDFLAQLKARDDAGNADALSDLRAALPAEILADFELRRLRNHQVNLAALGLAAETVLDTLLITADDTAEFAAGSVEQLWLGQWMRVLPKGGEVLMYPGADEVAAVLVARQLAMLTGQTARFSLACAEPDGLARIAKYENSPMDVAVARQLAAAGAQLVYGADADETLVIHAPDPQRRDLMDNILTFNDEDRQAARRTADLVATLLAGGKRVALADLRYANGGDPLLVEDLIARGLVMKLSAYGGWNTAGNSLGSVIAAAAAAQIGRLRGSLDETAARRMLIHRLLEDYAYQAIVRAGLQIRLSAEYGTLQYPTPEIEAAIAAEVTRDLADMLARIAPDAGARLGPVSFPWHRSFEINFSLTP